MICSRNLLLLAACAFAAVTPSFSSTLTLKRFQAPSQLQIGAPWPKFHADNFNSGNGAAFGAVGHKEWSFVTGNQVVSSPAIAQDGTIYFGSLDQGFFAVNPSGTSKWHFVT